VKSRFLWAAGLVLAGSLGAAADAACSVNVILASDRVDPDVFVWDTRDHLVQFEAGKWGTSKEIFERTILAKPGTRGVTDSCPPFSRTDSARHQGVVHVKVTSGEFRGHWGWVNASDLRVEAKVVNEPKH
jgi:hypothetical protein